MLKLTLSALLLGVVFSANAHQTNHTSETHYLVTFPDPVLEKKAKVTLHANLLADYDNGVLFSLSEHEKQRLIDFGATIKPASKLAAQLFQKQQDISQAVQNDTGIPGFSCYATVEETFHEIDTLVNVYPNYTELVDIGDSWKKQYQGDGYDLKVLKIGNKNRNNLPILFIQSAMHARELATAALTLDFAKQLLSERGTNADINWILDNRQIHILFQTNPDGRKIAERGISQRKNANQNHCPETSVGVDLNRNFSFGWNTVLDGSSGNSCSQIYRGKSPGSEPEIAALENYVRSIYPDQRGPNPSDAAPNNTPGLYLDIHSFGQLILWPWGGTEALAPNHVGLESLGRKLAYFNGYTPMQSVGLYPTDGTSDNLAYGELGVAHITFELGTAFFQNCGLYLARIKPDNLNALLYAAKVAEAPYQLTQGPDIIEMRPTLNDDKIILSAVATDAQFSNYGSQWPTQTITEVRYSINTLPSESDQTFASFTDGNADSVTETVTASFNSDQLVNNKAVVYMQAKDSDGYWGPVSALNIDTTAPEVNGQVTCSGAKCAFSVNDTSYPEYHWQLSTGESFTGSQIESVLPSLGDFTAILTVTNGLGVAAEQQIAFSVTELYQPEVQFSYQCIYLQCEFIASEVIDADSETFSLLWDFGDGISSMDTAYTHTYQNEGNYTVSLTVSDEHSQSSTVTLDVTVESEPEPVVLPQPDETNNKSSGGFGCLLLLTGLATYCRRFSKVCY